LSATSRDADPDTLRFTWEWDDGTFNVTNHDTSANPNVVVTSNVEHTWSTAGTYAIAVWVDDLTGETDHNVSTPIEVVVTLPPVKPGNIQLTADPDPALEDQPVAMTANATDGNGDALTITLEFGDGEFYTETTAGGTTGAQSIATTHTYVDPDTYTVWVHANDGTTNVSKNFTLVVEANSPPYIQLVESHSTMYNETFTIKPATLSDADGDDLTVWYDWGDGSPMTEGDPDNEYAASHVYRAAESFTLIAYADDGIAGHNVSETATVIVDKNLKPSIVKVTRSPTENTTIGVEITFTVIVKDPEGDPMVVKIIFGDTQTVTEESVTASPGVNATVTLTHTYTTDGEYTVRILVEDGKDHVNMVWAERTIILTIDPIPVDDDGGGLSIYYIVGGALLAIIVIAALATMMKKRKGKEAEPTDVVGAGGGMEGMQPPEDPPPVN